MLKEACLLYFVEQFVSISIHPTLYLSCHPSFPKSSNRMSSSNKQKRRTSSSHKATSMPVNSTSTMQSSSERAPLLSPNQRRQNREQSQSSSTRRRRQSKGWEWLSFLRNGDGGDEDEEGRKRLPTVMIKLLATLLGLLTLAIIIAICIQEYSDRLDPRFGSGRRYSSKLAKGKRGAVAAEVERCSDVGVNILKQKGNAVDAAIAATLCTGVIDMFSSGIGGGGFMIVRVPRSCSKAEKKEGLKYCSTKTTIDFRETAPSDAYPTMYEGRPNAARWGGLAVGVPGELKGLEEAHKRWGRLPWHKLVEPSIKLAESTWVSPELDKRLRMWGEKMIGDPDWSEIFVNQDRGTLLREGEKIKRHALAETLRAVAKNGSDAFYYGDIAKSMVEKAQSQGGIITIEDFANYKVEVREPVDALWKDRRVFTTPIPTSGPILLSLLQVTSGFEDWISKGPLDGLNAHRMVEAMKFGSSQRTRLGDPAFLDKHALKAVDKIPTVKEANRVRSRIDDNQTHSIEYYDPLYDIQSPHGTMHLSTVDEEGMAVALTSTVNLPFGSGVLDPKTGVILNDEMDDSSTPGVPNAFGLYPSPFNYPEPGKRPLSSTSPTIIEEKDGRFLISIGGSGGSRIYGSVAQVLFNLDWGMDLSTAIERPRIHHQLLPIEVSVESTTNEGILDTLRQKGHLISMIDIDSAVADVQAVMAKNGPGKYHKIMAASDSRKGGIAAAY